MNVSVLGSIAIDHIISPEKEAVDLMGGSASYASVCSSFFSSVGLIGIVGDDYPDKYWNVFKSKNIDLSGVQRADGKTFSWKGKYSEDFETVETLKLCFGVFDSFEPSLSESYRKAPVLLLGNTDPRLQMKVLNQMKNEPFVVVNTMQYYIDTQRTELLEVLKKADVCIINRSEAFSLSRQGRLIDVAEFFLNLNLKAIVITCGQFGSWALDSDRQVYSVPAYPIGHIGDTTGAGDSFCGAFSGYVARNPKKFATHFDIRSMIYGSVCSSFTVEKFSLEALVSLTFGEIEERYQFIKKGFCFD